LQLKEQIKYYSFSCNGLLSKKVTTPFIHKQDGQIQDCIVDKIFTLRARDNLGYEGVVYQLEKVLNKVSTKGLSYYL
jgi:hypothetical protein